MCAKDNEIQSVNPVCESSLCVQFLRSSLSKLPLLIILIEHLFVFVRREHILSVPPRGDGEASALKVIRYSAFSRRFRTGDLRLSQNHILCIFLFILVS